MGQYAMNAYDADIYIPGFKGLMQYGDQMGSDLRYSPDCMNVETPGGVLQPVPAMQYVSLIDSSSSSIVSGDIGEIMHLREEFSSAVTQSSTYPIYAGATDTSNINVTQNDTYLIAAQPRSGSTGGVYLLRMRGEPREWGGYSVKKIQDYGGGKISWCTYEHVADNNRYNILLYAMNGYLYAYSSAAVSGAVTTAFTPQVVATPSGVEVGYVARFADRIWIFGTGEDRDSIYYSAPAGRSRRAEWCAQLGKGLKKTVNGWEFDPTQIVKLGSNHVVSTKALELEIDSTQVSFPVSLLSRVGNAIPEEKPCLILICPEANICITLLDYTIIEDETVTLSYLSSTLIDKHCWLFPLWVVNEGTQRNPSYAYGSFEKQV